MNTYSVALFLHIVGALGFFVVLGLEWIGLAQIRGTLLPEEARAIMGLLKRTNRLGFVSILTIVATGVYMMLTAWRGVPWIGVVVGSFILETAIFVVFSRPRMAALERALDTEERAASNGYHALANHPILWISIQTRAAILLGIVFLKIAKPDLGGSLLTIGLAIVLGLASALPALRRVRVQVRPAARITIALVITAFVAALVLLAANSAPASTIPLSTPTSDARGVQTQPSEIPTVAGSSDSSTPAPTSSPETALPEGLAILQSRCTGCHRLQWLQQVSKTRSQWEETLSKMERRAKITDLEKNVLLDYLASAHRP